MKLIPTASLILLSVGTATAAAPVAIDASSASIPSDSAMGQRLLSKARRLENNNNNNNNVMTWGSGFSLKFENCATTSEYYGGYFGGQQQQGGNNNHRANYTGLYEQRLVHFKLCPTNTCGKGCSGGGDYVIDMNEYVRTYVEYQQELMQAKCEAVREACDCEDASDDEVS